MGRVKLMLNYTTRAFDERLYRHFRATIYQQRAPLLIHSVTFFFFLIYQIYKCGKDIDGYAFD